MNPISVSVEETMRLTSLGRTTVWKLIREGKLDAARVGRRTLVLYASIENLTHTLPHKLRSEFMRSFATEGDHSKSQGA